MKSNDVLFIFRKIYPALALKAGQGGLGAVHLADRAGVIAAGFQVEFQVELLMDTVDRSAAVTCAAVRVDQDAVIGCVAGLVNGGNLNRAWPVIPGRPTKK